MRTETVLWWLLLLVPSGAYCSPGDCSVSTFTSGAGPGSEASVSYLLPSRIPGHGHTDLVDTELYLLLPHLHTTGGTEFGMDVGLRHVWLPGESGVGLPSSLLQAAILAACAFRDQRGTEMRLQLAPGIYSELAGLHGRSFSAPVAVSVARRFRTGLVGMAGFVLRPDFARDILPVLSLGWNPGSRVRIALGVPRTSVEVKMAPGIALRAGGAWSSDSYAMNDVTHGNGTFTMEDIRVHLGLSYDLSARTSLRSDIGYVFERTLELDRPGRRVDEHFKPASVPFMRVGIQSTF